MRWSDQWKRGAVTEFVARGGGGRCSARHDGGSENRGGRKMYRGPRSLTDGTERSLWPEESLCGRVPWYSIGVFIVTLIGSCSCEPKCGAKQVAGDVFVLWFERLDCLAWSGRRG